VPTPRATRLPPPREQTTGSASGRCSPAAPGTVTTTAALLTVRTAPTVTTQPRDTTAGAGSTATFTAAANGRPTPTVRWQRSTNGGATFSDIPGATSTSYTTPTLTPADDGQRYRAVFTNPAGTTTTSAATLTVTAGPAVTTQPQDRTVDAGSRRSFTAAADGQPTPTVQWQRSTDAGATFTDVAGATATTYRTPPTTGADHGLRVRAVFTNPTGTATTEAATLTVRTAPAVTAGPQDQRVVAGSTATFSAAADGRPAPTVQWQRSTDAGATFTDLIGATSTSYTTPATADTDDGQRFRAVFRNDVGSTTSPVATLAVDVPPDVTTEPADQDVDAGRTATFTSAASGRPAPAVQWQRSTDGGRSFTDLPGATAASHTTPVTSVTDSGQQFRAVFTSSAGTATSRAAALSVSGPPVVTAQPADSTVRPATRRPSAPRRTQDLVRRCSGSARPTAGRPSPTCPGRRPTSYRTAPTTPQDDGHQFRAVFSDGAGTTTTAAATLVVESAPVVQTHPASRTTAPGEAATFSTSASGRPAPTVQWQRSTDGGSTFTDVAGATSMTYTTPATTARTTACACAPSSPTAWDPRPPTPRP
jgi:hypothetical protein